MKHEPVCGECGVQPTRVAALEHDLEQVGLAHQGERELRQSAQQDRDRLERELKDTEAAYQTAARTCTEIEQDRNRLEGFIEREGYRRCDIPACNCGSFHAGDAHARLREIYDALGGCYGTLPVPEIQKLQQEVARLRSGISLALAERIMPKRITGG